MKFLRWLGGIIVIFWLLGLFFRFAGKMIHLLIIAAVIIFLFDFFFGRRHH
ncbi:MAG: lmo0937 family membrane protein [Bacillota bacterium]|nr:lmo0937 family membrane protein [Bacillota bacterium]